MSGDDLLNVGEARDYLNVSEPSFWNLARRYNLPRYKRPLTGRRVYFRRSDLDELKNRRIPWEPPKRGEGVAA